MRLSTIFSVASAAAIVVASPLAERTLSPSACHEVDLIVDLLKLYKATPFCSSFLSIPTYTTTIVSVISTTATTRTITTTSVPISYSTSTVTVTTSTPTVTSTKTTIVATSTASSIVTTTSSYTAIVYTNGAAKRREVHPQPTAEIVGRGITIPEYLKELEKEAISSACLCLSIPIKTASATSTSTTTIDTVGLTTITLTTVSVVTTTTTITSAVPTFVISSATTVSTSTYTIYTAIATETVNPCQNIVEYGNGELVRKVTLNTDDGLVDSLEDCCVSCFFDTTNCYYYSFLDSFCSLWITTDKFGPTSPQCPSGVGSDPLGMARLPSPEGFLALGPCFGTNGA